MILCRSVERAGLLGVEARPRPPDAARSLESIDTSNLIDGHIMSGQFSHQLWNQLHADADFVSLAVLSQQGIREWRTWVILTASRQETDYDFPRDAGVSDLEINAIEVA
ncbi:hypothetical protein ASD53_13340 [Lysobacter sp. Root559]|nr:hypothetical protein ASD53_13340 [Lysobacter sp. Root559]KRA76507.1 hypothetical protein ASD78_02380 [Lysobacter sp. Root667]